MTGVPLPRVSGEGLHSGGLGDPGVVQPQQSPPGTTGRGPGSGVAREKLGKPDLTSLWQTVAVEAALANTALT
ncbi:hypothetical protein GCM10009767_10650 [Kocuria aegyptia]|uniref:Uncharacterized protein n=1 Tax=Kocuria aegyptia TaxID=330943 RepID=A0ABP4WJB4_9MICC